MPNWTDDGFVISMRPHGENAAIIGLFTRYHGRHMGLVHAASSKSKKATLEPGNHVSAEWRARLDTQLGTYALELVKANSATMLSDPLKLAALSSICAILDISLPEREPQTAIYDATSALLEVLSLADEVAQWLPIYLRWELGMLEALGFGLMLDKCAVSGTTQALSYVSPRTGHAVHHSEAGPYKDRLLQLPACLGGAEALADEFSAGLALTGHFMTRHIFGAVHKDLPQPRIRLAYLISQLYNNE